MSGLSGRPRPVRWRTSRSDSRWDRRRARLHRQELLLTSSAFSELFAFLPRAIRFNNSDAGSSDGSCSTSLPRTARLRMVWRRGLIWSGRVVRAGSVARAKRALAGNVRCDPCRARSGGRGWRRSAGRGWPRARCGPPPAGPAAPSAPPPSPRSAAVRRGVGAGEHQRVLPEDFPVGTSASGALACRCHLRKVSRLCRDEAEQTNAWR